MTRISLVVSDVDGTLLPKDKVLTEGNKRAVRKLHEAGIGFTIVSSRPTIGMSFLIEPLAISLPIGAFNGSSIVRRQARADRAASDRARRGAAQPRCAGTPSASISGCSPMTAGWTRNPDGEYVPHEKRAIKADPTIVANFAPHLTQACKIVGASSDAALLQRCEAAMQEAVGREATAVRSQTYYLDVTPAGHDKGTFVAAMAQTSGYLDRCRRHHRRHAERSGDVCQKRRLVRDGNATDDVKKHATHVTDSNERDGFAAAMETVLKLR